MTTRETLFRGDLDTPAHLRSLALGNFVLHQDGRVTAGNQSFARRESIALDLGGSRILRREWSDTLRVKLGSNEILRLEYSGLGGCFGAWERVTFSGDPPLYRFVPPGLAKRLLVSTFELLFASLYYLNYLLLCACRGWNHKDAPR